MDKELQMMEYKGSFAIKRVPNEVHKDRSDGILITDPETKMFIDGNAEISKMLGFSNEEIKNLGVNDIHPEKDLPYIVDQFERQFKEEFKLARDIPVKRKNGSVFYTEINSFPITINEKPYLAGIFRDITEHKKAEEIKKEKMEELEKFADIAVSRELKIGKVKEENEKLKAEIKELKKQLKKSEDN